MRTTNRRSKGAYSESKGAIFIGPQFARLQRITEDAPVTSEDHAEFLHLLQTALLLSLREKGVLNHMEYRHAEEALRRQHMSVSRKISEKEASG